MRSRFCSLEKYSVELPHRFLMYRNLTLHPDRLRVVHRSEAPIHSPWIEEEIRINLHRNIDQQSTICTIRVLSILPSMEIRNFAE
jgi:hypothetical protein